MTQPLIQTVYVARTTTDERGTTGGIILIALFEHEAEEAARGAGWYGGNGSVRQEWAYFPDKEQGDCYLLQSINKYTIGENIPEAKTKKIAAARAKLTDEEAELLGIKDK